MVMIMESGSNVVFFKRNIRRKLGVALVDAKGVEVPESFILYKEKSYKSGGLKKLKYIIPNELGEFVLYEMLESEYKPFFVDKFSKEKMSEIKKRFAWGDHDE